MPRYWRCRRISQGQVCGELNMSSKRKCYRCGKPRPPKRRPKHMAVLAQPYEWWVAQFGERCGICGVEPKDGKRLHRDHEHSGDGVARGLLCFQCNRKLGNKTADWLAAACAYLDADAGRRLRLQHDANVESLAPEAPIIHVCVYCGQEKGHSKRCSVTKFGVPEQHEARKREAA